MRTRLQARNFLANFENCCKQSIASRGYRNRSKLRHHLILAKNVFHEKHQYDPLESQKLKQHRLGALTVTNCATNTRYQIHDGTESRVLKVVHRNHLVEYYCREESLPLMTEEYVLSDKHHDEFYERFMSWNDGYKILMTQRNPPETFRFVFS